jgi:hypothetical protein
VTTKSVSTSNFKTIKAGLGSNVAPRQGKRLSHLFSKVHKSLLRRHFPRNGNERSLHTSRSDSGSHAQRKRMRRLFARRRPLAASAPVFDLRSRRLLRFLAEQARDEALPRDETSADSFLRAWRRVGVVLRRRTLLRIALTSFGVQAIVLGLSRPTNTGGISLNWPLHENGVLPPEFSGGKARSSSASSVNPASNISLRSMPSGR